MQHIAYIAICRRGSPLPLRHNSVVLQTPDSVFLFCTFLLYQFNMTNTWESSLWARFGRVRLSVSERKDAVWLNCLLLMSSVSAAAWSDITETPQCTLEVNKTPTFPACKIRYWPLCRERTADVADVAHGKKPTSVQFSPYTILSYTSREKESALVT